MGEWRTPQDARTLLVDVLNSPAFRISAETRAALAVALAESGRVVLEAYYVPDPPELWDMYRSLAEANHHLPRERLRWAMCAETHEALHRKYSRVVAAHTPELAVLRADPTPDEMSTIIDQIHNVMTTRLAASIPAALDAGRLFDMSIRRDPAARRPMFEIVDLHGA